MKRWALAVVMTSLLALGACDSGSGDDADDSRPGAGGSQAVKGKAVDPHYAVFPTKVPATGWELTNAIRQVGAGAQLGGLPGVDWYSEFDGPPSGETTPYLSLTGYSQSLEERKTESTSETSQVTDGDINGHTAFWSIDPGDLDSGATVTWEVTPDYTLEVFATGLTLDQLLAFARTVKDATEAEWTAAGGVVSDCAPTQSACPDSAAG